MLRKGWSYASAFPLPVMGWPLRFIQRPKAAVSLKRSWFSFILFGLLTSTWFYPLVSLSVPQMNFAAGFPAIFSTHSFSPPVCFARHHHSSKTKWPDGLDDPGFESRQEKFIFSFPERPDRPWGSLSGYCYFPGGKADGAWRLAFRPPSAEVTHKNVWSSASLLSFVTWAETLPFLSTAFLA